MKKTKFVVPKGKLCYFQLGNPWSLTLQTAVPASCSHGHEKQIRLTEKLLETGADSCTTSQIFIHVTRSSIGHCPNPQHAVS